MKKIGIVGRGFVGAAVEFGFSSQTGCNAEVRIYDNTSNTALGSAKKTGYSYTGGHNRDSSDWTLTALVEADHNSNGTNARVYNTWYWFDGNQNFNYGKQGDSITVYQIAASS